MPPRRDPLADQLHALSLLRRLPPPRPDDPEYAARQSLLRVALTGKSSFAVAAAADLLHETDRALLALVPEVFTRFLATSGPSDKGCTAKTALARALERTESSEDSVFRRGIAFSQPEPIFGGRQDSAVELRSICAMGLARLSPPGVLNLLAELLADPERGARAAAARALSCTGQDGAGPLLRYKALCGDDDPLVLAESLTSLVLLERAAALPFLRRFLTPDDPARADAAAMALGQSRLPQAIALLQEYAETPPCAERKAALVSLAMLREPAATEYLLTLVREADSRIAVLAVEALGLHRYDAGLHKKVAEAVSTRKSPALAEALAHAFAPS
jgi:HEAT repeat protein